MTTLPANLPSVARAKLPVVYENARTAISECARIDECADWANKAEALASYAKQAEDDSLRKMADRIQARAIRRCGELLEKIKTTAGRPAGNGSGAGPITKSGAARDAGMSRRQKRDALRVARVPGAEFEAAVESEDPPTVTALAERGKLAAPMFDLQGRRPEDFKVATSAFGMIRSVSEFCAKHEARTAVAGLLPRELKRRSETLAQIRSIVAWLKEIDALLQKERS